LKLASSVIGAPSDSDGLVAAASTAVSSFRYSAYRLSAIRSASVSGERRPIGSPGFVQHRYPAGVGPSASQDSIRAGTVATATPTLASRYFRAPHASRPATRCRLRARRGKPPERG